MLRCKYTCFVIKLLTCNFERKPHYSRNYCGLSSLSRLVKEKKFTLILWNALAKNQTSTEMLDEKKSALHYNKLYRWFFFWWD